MKKGTQKFKSWYSHEVKKVNRQVYSRKSRKSVWNDLTAKAGRTDFI